MADGLAGDAQIAVSQTKKFTNSLFGLCMHWIGSGSKQHKKRRGKSVANEPIDATGGPRGGLLLLPKN